MSIPFCFPSEGPGLRSLPAGHFSGPLSRLAVTLALIQLAKHKGDGKSPGEDELLLHFFSYCIILLFRPFFFSWPLAFYPGRQWKERLMEQGLGKRGGNRTQGKMDARLSLPTSVRIELGWDIHKWYSQSWPSTSMNGAISTTFWRGLDDGVLKWQGIGIMPCCRLGQPLESWRAVAEVPNIWQQLCELSTSLHHVLLKMAVGFISDLWCILEWHKLVKAWNKVEAKHLLENNELVMFCPDDFISTVSPCLETPSSRMVKEFSCMILIGLVYH